MELNLRTQKCGLDESGHTNWQVHEWMVTTDPESTALLLCDVWDIHWCRGAVERLEAMIPRMNEVVSAVRSLGVQIIHAPSSTMDFYRETPARKRVQQTPAVEPTEQEHIDPPLPIDASDDGSDTGEAKTGRPWSRQHPGIVIDQNLDLISDDGSEVFSCLTGGKRNRMLILGVHTNMCVLHRSFGIKQMVRWGVEPVLIRDLTDTMYNPAMPPYVSHDEGTRLTIEYIEKFWCPTVLSDDLCKMRQ